MSIVPRPIEIQIHVGDLTEMSWLQTRLNPQ